MNEQEVRMLITLLVIITTVLMVWARRRPSYKKYIEKFRNGCNLMTWGCVTHIIAFNFSGILFWVTDAIGGVGLLLSASTIFLIGIVGEH